MAEQKTNNHATLEVKRNILFFLCRNCIDEEIQENIQSAGLEIHHYDSPDETLKQLSKKDIKVVVADYEPPLSKKLDLMQRIKKKFPGINRVLLSRPQQRKEIIHLLLKGVISAYFEKPDGLPNLPDGLLNMFKARQKLQNEKLLQLFDSEETIPVFPSTYNRFMQAVENDKSMREIAQLIERDVSISAQVLRIANSEFYRTSPIGSIERAGIYLGLDTIKNIVLTVSLSSMKRLGSKEQAHLDRIVHHSFQVNRSFRKIYMQQSSKELSDQYASVGITHDIGKIIMLQYLPKRFNRIIKYREKYPEISFYRSELELGFEGCTHAEIGAYFLNLWNFPEAGVFTALFHHSTEEFAEEYRELLDIFTIVNELAHDTELTA